MTVLETIILFFAETGIIGFFFWLIQRKIDNDARERRERDKKMAEEAEAREKLREEERLRQMRYADATMTLSQAVARAVQRIPDAKCNGDMSSALKYAEQVQREQKDSLMEIASKID